MPPKLSTPSRSCNVGRRPSTSSTRTSSTSTPKASSLSRRTGPLPRPSGRPRRALRLRPPPRPLRQIAPRAGDAPRHHQETKLDFSHDKLAVVARIAPHMCAVFAAAGPGSLDGLVIVSLLKDLKLCEPRGPRVGPTTRAARRRRGCRRLPHGPRRRCRRREAGNAWR